MGNSSVGAFDIHTKGVPLTMYALDIDGRVIAKKDAVEYHRCSSAKTFFKEVGGVHAVWVRYQETWAVIHGAYDSWFILDKVLLPNLPKPFQMYLMLTEV